MHWLGAIIGAVLGLIFAEADHSLLGMLLGAAIGWQALRLMDLDSRVKALEASSRTATRDTPKTEPKAGSRRPDYRPDPWSVATAASASAATPARTAAGSAPTQDSQTALPPAPANQHQATPSPAENPWLSNAAKREPASEPESITTTATQPGLAARVGSWFLNGNVPVTLGSLVLFAGIAAALKYAADQGMLSVPIEARLSGFALLAMLMIAWGWRRRELQPAFGLSLQGAGLGVALLTVFAAFRLHQLLPAGAAFAITLALVACAALLALLQNSMALAVLGLLAGYLAPLLISTGTDNHVALFGYYLILNAGVLAIAWIRPWRVLNLIGFGFTFALMSLWTWSLYQPENFASIEPFLIAYFLFFTAIPVLYALRQPPRRRGLVDGTLVFGTPLLAYPMQAGLLQGEAMSLAVSALAMAGLYALLSVWLLRVRGIELLAHSFALLAVGFATLAIPLALAAPWTVAIWTLEGAALVWLGLRQQQRLPQLAGWLLQVLAAAAYLMSVADDAWRGDPGEWLLLNSHGLSVLMMTVAAMIIAWLHDRSASRQRWLVWPPFVAGVLWWTLAGVREIDVRYQGYDAYLATLLMIAVSTILATTIRVLLPWPRMGWVVPLAALLAVLLALASSTPEYGLLNWPGFAFWALTLAVLLAALRYARDPMQRGLGLAHLLLLWAVALVLGIGLHQHASDPTLWNLGQGWHPLLLSLPLGLLLAASHYRPDILAWPMGEAFHHYRHRWSLSAALALGLLFVISLGNDGDSSPLRFLPLFNPLELFQLTLLLAMIGYLRERRAGERDQHAALTLWALAVFAFISFAGLRGVHHLSDAPWSEQILSSAVAQSVLTLSWSVVGVSAWIVGSRQRNWPIWLGGAVLMGLVLIKLVVIDRQHMGGVAGIVSLLAVGALLVVVGRIAPTPPRHDPIHETKTDID